MRTCENVKMTKMATYGTRNGRLFTRNFGASRQRRYEYKNYEEKKSTPVRFELTLPREMPKLTCSCIAGHRVNHSAKVPHW